MRFYQRQHGFYCGVDLHARTMHVCVVDADGVTRERVNLPCDAGRFLKVIGPYREQVVVSCECLFASRDVWCVVPATSPTHGRSNRHRLQNHYLAARNPTQSHWLCQRNSVRNILRIPHHTFGALS